MTIAAWGQQRLGPPGPGVWGVQVAAQIAQYFGQGHPTQVFACLVAHQHKEGIEGNVGAEIGKIGMANDGHEVELVLPGVGVLLLHLNGHVADVRPHR